MSSCQRVTSGRMILVRARVIMVAFIAVVALGVISLLAMVLDPVVCIPITNDIPKVLSTLTALIQREQYSTGRVPMRALVMVGVLTSPPSSLVKGRVYRCSDIKHCMEVLYLRGYLLAILRKQGCELIHNDPGGQIIMCMHAVNLLTLPLNPAYFFVEHRRLIPESVMTYQTLSVELGVVP
jgi:hypothetical protein